MIISDICKTIDRLAPEHLAQEWDNVGLLVGDDQAECNRVLVCGDLTHVVLDEAIAAKVKLVLAYHPPLFRPINKLRAHSKETDAIVWRTARHGIAIYATHTALDAAEGGTNDVVAALCGATDLAPFVHVEAPARELKLVVFVPAENADTVADALAAAGAGVIGNYERCSFRIPGTGTFCGNAESNPTIGEARQFETVDELRLEMVLPSNRLPAVVTALRAAHPYEEPAFDLYPLTPPPLAGIGRCGTIAPPVPLAELAGRLRQALPQAPLLMIGPGSALVSRVVICVGAAGTMVLDVRLGPGDCVVTGELRHHEALAIERAGATAVCLGHWSSERPGVARLTERLDKALVSVTVQLSARDSEPFRTVDRE